MRHRQPFLSRRPYRRHHHWQLWQSPRKIADTYGLNVSRIEFPWGEAADPATVEARLKELPPYSAVLMTHNETSTGVTNDVQTLSALVHRVSPDALVVVDAVSSMGCVPLEMDAWGLDVVFTGSQKGWMVPPGIMMIAASPRAWEAHKTAKLPRFYFDWTLSRKKLEIFLAASHHSARLHLLRARSCSGDDAGRGTRSNL